MLLTKEKLQKLSVQRLLNIKKLSRGLDGYLDWIRSALSKKGHLERKGKQTKVSRKRTARKEERRKKKKEERGKYGY